MSERQSIKHRLINEVDIKRKIYLYNMRLALIFLLLTVRCFSQAQDSLLYQLQQIENDTERVNQLYKKGFELRNTNLELAYQFAVVCHEEALKTTSDKHLAKSYNLLGVVFYKKADYESAIAYQKKSLVLNSQYHYQLGCAINQTNLGNIYAELNYNKQAEGYYLQALQTYNRLNNTLQLTRCLINIGALKNNEKQYAAANNQYKQALLYATELNNMELMSDCYNNLGVNFISQLELDSAELNLQEGLKLRLQIDDELELINSYNNLAHLFVVKKDFAKAKEYLKLSETLCLSQDYAEGKVELYSNWSFWNEEQKQFEKALYYKKKQIALRDSIQQIDKEDNQLLFLGNDIVPENNHNDYWMWTIIGILTLIIFGLIFKLKK